MGAAIGVEHRLARISAKHQRAALVGGVLGFVGVGDDHPEAELAEHAPGLADQSFVRAQVVRLVVQADAAVGLDRDTILDPRQVFGHRQPVHATSRPRFEGPHREHRCHRLRHHAVRAALRLDLSQRERTVRALEVEVVDRHRLLEHGVVDAEGVEALHHGRQVRHVALADQARRVGEAAGMLVVGRPQQQRR